MLGAVTCGLSASVHSVWSQSGPKSFESGESDVPPRCERSAARSFTVVGAKSATARSPSAPLVVDDVAVLDGCAAPFQAVDRFA